MTCPLASLRTLMLVALGGALSACTCAGWHQADGGADTGADAGIDSGSIDSGYDGGPVDAGAADDAGFDSGHVCPPTSHHFTADGGYRHFDDTVTLWCERRLECRVFPQRAARGGCFDGYCCNGTRFDEATCACFCGSSPECALGTICCALVEDGDPVCVTDPTECFVFFS